MTEVLPEKEQKSTGNEPEAPAEGGRGPDLRLVKPQEGAEGLPLLDQEAPAGPSTGGRTPAQQWAEEAKGTALKFSGALADRKLIAREQPPTLEQLMAHWCRTPLQDRFGLGVAQRVDGFLIAMPGVIAMRGAEWFWARPGRRYALLVLILILIAGGCST